MKTFLTLSLAALIATTTTTVSANEAEDGHTHTNDHEHGHKCACDAITYDFDIDCANTQAMTDALARLQAGQCASNCNNFACEKDWLIVQTHHDHCPEDGIPVAIENGFHDYDGVCSSCDIVRQEIPGAPQCPTVNCTDGSGNLAFQRLLTKSCNSQCSETDCKDDWLTLRVAHDFCENGALSQSSEEGLHALEEPCANFQCNLPLDQIANTLECSPEDLKQAHDDHGDDHADHDASPNMAPGGSGNGDGFDMGSAGVTNLALGAVALFMNLLVAALF
ncbi:unnamed protein product [Cylindrotheca closterium]|uniref:Uncharacterized protein n=1 Tax=Cylindrotheca closterium TaxID=2856 RepID=A0AAD2CH77_9STRA|nr:unnamed protein product [Cylindrotheca closterium]